MKYIMMTFIMATTLVGCGVDHQALRDDANAISKAVSDSKNPTKTTTTTDPATGTVTTTTEPVIGGACSDFTGITRRDSDTDIVRIIKIKVANDDATGIFENVKALLILEAYRDNSYQGTPAQAVFEKVLRDDYALVLSTECQTHIEMLMGTSLSDVASLLMNSDMTTTKSDNGDININISNTVVTVSNTQQEQTVSVSKVDDADAKDVKDIDSSDAE